MYCKVMSIFNPEHNQIHCKPKFTRIADYNSFLQDAKLNKTLNHANYSQNFANSCNSCPSKTRMTASTAHEKRILTESLRGLTPLFPFQNLPSITHNKIIHTSKDNFCTILLLMSNNLMMALKSRIWASKILSRPDMPLRTVRVGASRYGWTLRCNLLLK